MPNAGDEPNRTNEQRQAPTRRAAKLTTFERVGALLIGLLAGGAGGVATFLTSNQAASTALILVGAAFLVITTQGTPVLELNKEGFKVAERAEEIGRGSMRVPREQDPRLAYLEGAIAAEPDLAELSAVTKVRDEIENDFTYTLAVQEAFVRLADSRYQVVEMGGSDLWDIKLSTVESGTIVYVEAYYEPATASRISLQTYSHFRHRAQSLDAPLVLVTNALRVKGVRSGGIEMVTWRDESDDEELRAGLGRALQAAPRKP